MISKLISSRIRSIFIQQSILRGSMSDIADLRVNYVPAENLDIDKLPSTDPFQLFGLWFQEARDCRTIEEPNAMTLATVSGSGAPSARMVLLKGFDPEGFVFFSNYDSRKGKELAENPNAALLFYWEALHKQVRIEGTVEKTSAAASDQYFHSRPHGSQLGAYVSHQSTPLVSHQVLHDKYSELQELHPTEEHKVPRPECWGGYLLVPHAIEFWQGQTNRLHRRIQFTHEIEPDVDKSLIRKSNDGWSYYILSS